MVPERLVPLTVAVPKSYRDLLRKIALKESLKNPDRMVTTSQLGRKILCEYLDRVRGHNHDETGRGKEP